MEEAEEAKLELQDAGRGQAEMQGSQAVMSLSSDSLIACAPWLSLVLVTLVAQAIAWLHGNPDLYTAPFSESYIAPAYDLY